MAEIEHLSAVTIAAYRSRQLRPSELLPVARHLEKCSLCRAKLAPQGVDAQLLHAFGEPASHLTYEDLESLAQESGKKANHLEECPDCAAELEDLRAFRSGLDARRRKRLFLPIAGIAFAVLALLGIALYIPDNTAAKKKTPLILSLRDGSRTVGLDASQALQGAEGIDGASRELLKTALTSRKLPASADSGSLIRSRETLLGRGQSQASALRLDEPVGTAVVQEQPDFHWSAPSNASRFVVSVYTTDFEPVAASPPLSVTEWQCSVKLHSGATYIWTVSARVGSETVTVPHAPDPEARFRVLSEAEQAELQNAKTVAGSDLLIAIVAARAGVFSEAQAALDRLEKKNPGSPLVASLQSSLRQQSKPAK